MLRKLAISLAVAGVLGATHANALGLGEIRIHSALNEPLKAEIELLQLRGVKPQQIQPRMANIDEFSLAGLDKSRFLGEVEFRIDVTPDGRSFVQLTSQQPVREPFLNFLVEVNWPSGRLVREYTLLLDPPVFDRTPNIQPVRPAVASARPKSLPVSSFDRSTDAPVASSQPVVVSVGTHDTLWNIAVSHLPSRTVNGRQMMLAILDKNPHAFVDKNVNRLLAGTKLTMPTLEEVQKFTAARALEEIQEQTASWKQDKVVPDLSSSQSDSTKAPTKEALAESPQPTTNTTAPDKPIEAELKIVAPTDAQQISESGTASDQPSMTVAADQLAQLAAQNQQLEQRVSESLENYDKIQLENQDLNERLDGMQQQLEAVKRLLEVKNKEVLALQSQATPPPAQASKSLLSTILETPMYLAGLAGALVTLVGGLLLLILRRRKSGEEEAGEKSGSLVNVPDELSSSADDDLQADTVEQEQEAEESLEKSQEVAEEALVQDDLHTNAEELTDLDLDLDMELSSDEPDEIDRLLDDVEFDLSDSEEEHSVAEEQAKPESNVSEENIVDDELEAILADFDERGESALPSNTDTSEDLANLGLDDLDLALDDDLPVSDTVEVAQLDDDDLLSDSLDDILGESEKDLPDDDELEFSPNSSPQEEVAADAPEVIEEEEDALEFNVSEPAVEQPTQLADEKPKSRDDEEDDLEFSFDSIKGDEDSESSLEDQIADIDSLLEQMGGDVEDDFSSDQAELDAVDDGNQVAHVDEDLNDELMLDLDDLLSSDDDGLLMEEEGATAQSTGELYNEDDELDALLASLNDEDLENAKNEKRSLSSAEAEEELTANIAHDLDLDFDDQLEETESSLDQELDELLAVPDTDVELEEFSSLEDEEIHLSETSDNVEGWSLLKGADEVETKLDLARAYIDMEDVEGAKDILSEVIKEGASNQRQEAEQLLKKLS